MKISKNFEAIFLVAAVLATLTTYATAKVPTYHAPRNAHLSAVVAEAKMQVVTVSHKRLSPVEKAQLH